MTNRNAKKNARNPGCKPPADSRSATAVTITKPADKPSKLDRLVDKLVRPEGAMIADLTAITGWQAHSVRGALAGSLKKRGYKITSRKVEGTRRYRIEVVQ